MKACVWREIAYATTSYSPSGKFLQGLWVNETRRSVAETMIRKSGRCHANWRLSEQLASHDSQSATREAEEVQHRCADVLSSPCLEASRRTVLQTCHRDNSRIKSPLESFSKSLLRISRSTNAVIESGQQHALAYQTLRSMFLCHFSVLGQTTIAVVRYNAGSKVATTRPLSCSDSQKHSLARPKAPAFLPNHHHINAANSTQESDFHRKMFPAQFGKPTYLSQR